MVIVGCYPLRECVCDIDLEPLVQRLLGLQLEELTTSREFAEFLTLASYDLLD